MEEKIERTTVELYWENGNPFLKVVYRIETHGQVILRTFPKVEVPFRKTILPSITQGISGPYVTNYNLPLWSGPIEGRDDKHFYWDIVTETKTPEMTLDEIEKMLGYKVKIVTK